jgi:hypothetical protein
VEVSKTLGNRGYRGLEDLVEGGTPGSGVVPALACMLAVAAREHSSLDEFSSIAIGVWLTSDLPAIGEGSL